MAREYVIRPSVAPLPRIDFANELNAQQLAAVTCAPGPALVLAGAGSGKTRTLTYRVAYLLENAVPAQNILLLTFTNKASREMLERVAALVSHDLTELWGGTFHSIGNRILRRHLREAGFESGFTVMDREDADELLQGALLDMRGGKVSELPVKPSVVGEVVSYAVNVGRSVGDVIPERFAHLEEWAELIHEAAGRYAKRKHDANALDFDDLLLLTVRLLETHSGIADIYQRRFQFVLVDEYQDTNPLQSKFIDLLSARHRNLMAVGDDAQAIYSWRGADYRNILSFGARYPGAQIYKVETNYRSTPEILEVANSAIEGMQTPLRKELVSSRKGGELPRLIPLQTGGHQAKFVVSRMLELNDAGMPWRDMAVLYRAHYHSMELQMEMTRHAIPFQITSGLRFFEQAHVKDVGAFLKFVVNPQDEVAFKRMVRLLPGIGDRSADGLWRAVAPLGRELAESRLAGGSGFSFSHAFSQQKVPARSASAWKQLGHTLEEIAPGGIPLPPLQMLQSVREAVYDDYARTKFPDYDTRREDLNTLASFASQYPNAEDFLDQLALLGSAEPAVTARDSGGEGVVLSSVHQAKGLEWKVVFVIWLTEGMFPSQRSLANLDSLEEERRLFYVAVTRAEDELYLCWPFIKRNPGGGDAVQRISPFLEDIPPELLEEWRISGGGF
jgi:DNA helicase II / ATP-dependent DNA helicase PcrA